MAKASDPAAVWVSVTDLVPWQDNPRIHDAAMEALTISIQQFGFSAPIVARKADNTVIAGHARLKAAKLLGLDTVPVRYMDLSESDAKALAIADNRVTELSQWDDDGLLMALEELQKEDKLAATGFSDDDVEALVKSTAEGGGKRPAKMVTCPSCGFEFDPKKS